MARFLYILTYGKNAFLYHIVVFNKKLRFLSGDE